MRELCFQTLQLQKKELNTEKCEKRQKLIHLDLVLWRPPKMIPSAVLTGYSR